MLFQSRYDGPVEWLTLRPAPGFRELKVIRPALPEQLLDDPEVREWNRAHNYMPYWASLWPGAHLLARVLATRAWPEKTRALELGCGLGYAGLVGLAAGMDVCFTDIDATPLQFVERSAIQNGFARARFETRAMDWRDPIAARWQLVLAADVTYEAAFCREIAGALARLLDDDGEGLLAGPDRAAGAGLSDALAAEELIEQIETVVAEDERGKAVRGWVRRIRRGG